MSSSLMTLVACAAVTFIATITVGNCQDVVFGECEPERASCRECYFGLVQAALGRDENVFNLSLTFTPPTFDHPSSVIVNYRFFNECNDSNDSCVNEIHTWFWAESGAYLLHPLTTFQFISLLFGNAQPIYEREVYVTLDATECYGVSADHMTLLTQRLKIYIQEQSFYPKMDDNYLPVAANSTTIVDILGNSPYARVSLSSEHILFICPLFVTIIILALMVLVVLLYACGGICKLKNSMKANLKNHIKATILGFTVASFNRILIFVALDIAALGLRSPCSNPKVEAICEFSDLMYNIPGVLLACDSLSLIFFLGSIVFAICAPKLFLRGQNGKGGHQNLNSSSKNQSIRHVQYFCCTLAIMGFVFSCLMHSPHIIMAYLSDAHYATSMLVYYTTILCIEFGIFQYTFRVHFDVGSLIYKRKLLTGVLIFVQAVLIYCLALSASFFFYYIPISNTVTNLPNEGIIVYQTALILLGAFITYKALFKSKKTEQDKHSLNLYQLTRQLKERAIAELNIEVDNGNHHITIIKIMKDKISHLQKEITLLHIKHKLMSLVSRPNDISHQIKSARLKKQQSEIVHYLKSEVSRLDKEVSCEQFNQPDQQDQAVQADHTNQNNGQVEGGVKANEQGVQNQNPLDKILSCKRREIYRLRCEILEHLLTMKSDLEERFHNQDSIKTVVREITFFKEEICKYLNNEKELLELEQQTNKEAELEIKEQILSIEEELGHLDEMYNHVQQYYYNDDQQPNNAQKGDNLEMKLLSNEHQD